MRLHCRRASNGKHNAQQTNWASRSRTRSSCPTAIALRVTHTHRGLAWPSLGYSIGGIDDDDDDDEMPLQNS